MAGIGGHWVGTGRVLWKCHSLAYTQSATHPLGHPSHPCLHTRARGNVQFVLRFRASLSVCSSTPSVCGSSWPLHCFAHQKRLRLRGKAARLAAYGMEVQEPLSERARLNTVQHHTYRLPVGAK